MGHTMQRDLFDDIPMQTPEERHVLGLHVRVEFGAASAIGGANRKPDQFGSQPAYPPVGLCNRQARAPPDTRCAFVDADRADYLGRISRESGNCHQRQSDLINLVAVVMTEDPLFAHEYLVAQGGGTAHFPDLGCSADQEFGADKGRNVVLHCGTFSFS